MAFFDSRFLRVYIIPGAVLQSVIVAGGYGTGRELVEYFTSYGALGGLLGMLVTTVCWALVLAVTYEFARTFRVYDYRSFFRELLGRGWPAFEVLYILMFLLVLAVVGAAAAAILRESLGLPDGVGLVIMLAAVGALVFLGREIVTRSLAIWSFVLYSLFIVYFGIALWRFGGDIGAQLTTGEALAGWGVSGFTYAMYNLATVPAVLFAVRAIETRREAVLAGLAASLICIIPALLFHISFLAGYPGVTAQEIPVYWMIGQLGVPLLLLAYVIGLFGTFIETGAGFIQGINERIDSWLIEANGRTMSKPMRAIVGVTGILLSAGLATFGIIDLIARGYGTIAWGFFAVYVVPVMTYGVYKLVKRGTPGPGQPGSASPAEAHAAGGSAAR
jgi:uncharacterized membrane protein YkvI